MSEAEQAPAVAAETVQSSENGAEPMEITETSPTTAPDAEVKTECTTETAQNGDNKPEDKAVESTEKAKDEIDEKIDRYARDTKRPFQRRSKQIKSNFENLPETDDADEIRRQVEFYFSDANLHQDAFLLKETGGSKNKPFPLKQLHTFKRMKRFQPFSAVVAAVKESKDLELNENDEITRKAPLSEDYSPEDTRENKRIYEEKSMARSVYAKGFGAETETTQTDIEEFFSPYGDVSAVRLRRDTKGEFKGSVLVEFSDDATASAFLELDPKPKWQDKYELEFRTKKDWFEEKQKQEANRPRRDFDRNDNKRKTFDNDRRGGRGNKRGRGGRGGRDDRRRDRSADKSRNDDGGDDWRDRRDRDQKQGRRGGRGRRGDDDRSKRDDKEDEGQDKTANDDEISKLSKKRSRDENETAAEPEAKKVKEETSGSADA